MCEAENWSEYPYWQGPDGHWYYKQGLDVIGPYASQGAAEEAWEAYLDWLESS